MIMKNKKLLFTFILSFFSTIIVAQKTIKYEYSGGSHDVNKELLLYTDSTFTFNLEMGFPFGHSRKTKGFYIIEDSLLTLITKKRFAFLYRKNHKQIGRASCRERVLMPV